MANKLLPWHYLYCVVLYIERENKSSEHILSAKMCKYQHTHCDLRSAHIRGLSVFKEMTEDANIDGEIGEKASKSLGWTKSWSCWKADETTVDWFYLVLSYLWWGTLNSFRVKLRPKKTNRNMLGMFVKMPVICGCVKLFGTIISPHATFITSACKHLP